MDNNYTVADSTLDFVVATAGGFLLKI